MRRGEWEERKGGDTIKGVKWEVRMKRWEENNMM